MAVKLGGLNGGRGGGNGGDGGDGGDGGGGGGDGGGGGGDGRQDGQALHLHHLLQSPALHHGAQSSVVESPNRRGTHAAPLSIASRAAAHIPAILPAGGSVTARVATRAQHLFTASPFTPRMFFSNTA